MGIIDEVANAVDDTNPDWTPVEEWAWNEIASGRIADFAAAQGTLDPRLARKWSGSRALGSAFLRALLFEKEWSDRIPADGVRIVGACWTEDLILSHATLTRPLCLEACRFEGAIDLTGLRLEDRLSLRGSALVGEGHEFALILDGAAVRRADLRDCFLRKGLSATGAAIDGALDLKSAMLNGALNLESAKAGSISLRHAVAGQVIMTNCEVEQDVDLSGATISGQVKMNDLRVGQDLLLGGSESAPALFRKEISLVGAYVGGSVWLSGVTVRGALKMNGLEVEKSLFMRFPRKDDERPMKGRALFEGRIDLTAAQIHGYLELLGARCKGAVRLLATQIGQNLSAWAEYKRPTIFEGRVTISSSHVKGAVDFSGAQFKSDLIMLASSFERVVDLSGAAIGGKLDLADARIDRTLFMNDFRGSVFRCKGQVRLQNASVKQVEFAGRCGDLSCSGLEVNLHVFIRATSRGWAPVVKGGVDLSYANIQGVLDFNGASLGAGLSLERIKVGRDVRMEARIKGPISIAAGDIGGDLTLGAPDAIEVVLTDLHVAHDLSLAGAFGAKVNLARARIDHVLDLGAARFGKGLDISASKVGGQLCLRLSSPDLAANAAKLDLRDAAAGSLQIFAPLADAADWPDPGSVQLDGFTYDRLGGAGVEQADEMIERPVAWFVRWLRLDAPYSPQPYEHLATVMRQAGQTEKANNILYEARERAREEAWSSEAYLRWFGLSLLNWSIGYGIGYRYFRALIPTLVLTVLGTILLGTDPVGVAEPARLGSFFKKLAFSFDQLLPILELDPNFSKVGLPDPVSYYFYVHRALGFLLGSFIGAGIAGLTQRSRS